MKNIRIATLIKIIIPVYLLCVIVIFICFFSYNSAVYERNDILHRTLEGLGGALVWQATPALNNAEARSDALYVLLVFVIGVSVVITLASLLIITYKLLPIRNLVNRAIELSKENIEENIDNISNDELGFLTSELARKIKSLDTNMKLLEEAVEKANAASRAKSDFLSAMSHEMRTPMNAIIGMTSIARREIDPERINYALEKIETASTHLLGVINDILDISKIEVNKMELSCINFTFSDMIKKICNVALPKMQEKQQNFSLEIDPEIPKILFGDDQRLSQVIVNILSNACKFTPKEGNISFISKLISAKKDECVIQMLIKDSGIGIPKEEQDKLFSKFYQAEAGISRKYGGTGLGLAISKNILELMGGDIWVESEPEKGSCFFFTVTLGVAGHVDGEADMEQTAGPQRNDDIDYSGKIVLLVDDVDINLEITCALLEPTGIIIDTAASGIQAVEMYIANPNRYDLIFMDIQMPGIDGMETTKMIRAFDSPKSAAIPIIAMTANVFREDIEKCMDAGMNGHLGKPINIDDVMGILSRHLKV